MTKQNILLAVIAVTTAACGPIDMTGEYSVAVTNGENGCMLDRWVSGESTTGIPVTITQEGSAAMATVGGGSGIVLGLYLGQLGSPTFAATVNGNSALFSRLGSVNGNDGSCQYTPVVDLDTRLNGDTLSGTVVYRFQTNNAADCGYRTNCRTVQQFNGVRPPR